LKIKDVLSKIVNKNRADGKQNRYGFDLLYRKKTNILGAPQKKAVA
jgi:hypothetical protein